jgi:hypothetical protein
VHSLEEDEYIELSKELFDKAAEYWIQALKLADNYPGARNWLKVTGRLRKWIINNLIMFHKNLIIFNN